MATAWCKRPDAADLNRDATKFAKPPSEPSSDHIDNCAKQVHTRFVIYVKKCRPQC
jgi:hypothetical protein